MEEAFKSYETARIHQFEREARKCQYDELLPYLFIIVYSFSIYVFTVYLALHTGLELEGQILSIACLGCVISQNLTEQS